MFVMLLLGYDLWDVHVMETWNTLVTKSDSAQLCYLDKMAGGRSTLVIAFESRTKKRSNGLFSKDVNDVLSQKNNSLECWFQDLTCFLELDWSHFVY